MTPEEIVKKRLAARLVRLRRQIATLTAEVEMTEHYLADAEKSVVRPRLKFRKNSQAKWSIQGQIRQHLAETASPVRAQAMYDRLRVYDPQLNPSTFRSHIKRMVEAGIINREGSRGHYQLVKRDEVAQIVDREPTPRRRRVRHSIYER